MSAPRRHLLGCDGCLGYTTWHYLDGDAYACEGCSSRRPLAEVEQIVAERERREEELAEPECPGHLCIDAADMFPHSGIGDTFECDGSCVA